MFQFEHHKKLAGIVPESSSHLLECLSPKVYKELCNTYGSELTTMTEDSLTSKIKRLVVRKCNAMASTIKVLKMD